MKVLNINQSAIKGDAYAVYENGIRFALVFDGEESFCSCHNKNCRHQEAVKAALKTGQEIFDELVTEDDESPMWTYKTNAPVPTDTLQFDPQTQLWFNDQSPKYAFNNYVDAILNRCPVGIYAGFANVDDICSHGMITHVEFKARTRTLKFWFDNQDGAIECLEDAVLPIG